MKQIPAFCPLSFRTKRDIKREHQKEYLQLTEEVIETDSFDFEVQIENLTRHFTMNSFRPKRGG